MNGKSLSHSIIAAPDRCEQKSEHYREAPGIGPTNPLGNHNKSGWSQAFPVPLSWPIRSCPVNLIDPVQPLSP